MRAHVLHSQGAIATSPLRLEELPTPVPTDGELLIRVEACGLCRTDLHIIEGDLALRRTPIIPGHQVVGRVVKLGKGCSGFTTKDRVGIAWLRSTCGQCEFCNLKRENLCEASKYTGYHEHGGYAEYTVVPAEFAYKLPDNLDPAEITPLLCAGIIGYRALVRSNINRGGKLALYGFGSSAHITIQVAKSWGCEVFVATRGEAHRNLARSMGADWVGDTFDSPPTLVDSAIVFAPAGEIVPVALRCLKKGGTVALAGIHMSTIPAMEYQPHLFHEKQLVSVEANTREDGRALLEIAARIPIRPKVRRFPFEAANEALCLLRQDQIEGTAVLTIPQEK